jgi:hypothetical protein
VLKTPFLEVTPGTAQVDDGKGYLIDRQGGGHDNSLKKCTAARRGQRIVVHRAVD